MFVATVHNFSRVGEGLEEDYLLYTHRTPTQVSFFISFSYTLFLYHHLVINYFVNTNHQV